MALDTSLAATRAVETPFTEPADWRLLQPWRAIQAPAVRLVSSDVFDTLVWRKVPTPADVFPFVGHQLHELGALHRSLDAKTFAVLRVAAEEHARERRRSRNASPEVTLAEIYEEFPAWTFDGGSAGQAIATELAVERGFILADPDAADMLRAVIEAGKQLVLVSDTYFSGEQLRSLLCQPLLGWLSADVPIFTSSDHRVGKGHGLFGIVMRQLGAAPEELVHLGDNEETDVTVPRRLGIAACLYRREPASYQAAKQAEHQFKRSGLAGDVEWWSLATGLEFARAKAIGSPEREGLPEALAPFWDFGATILGPVLVGFCEWIHANARGRVACLMREGELLAELLRLSGAYLNSQVSASTIWLNRDVCLRALIVNGTHSELVELCKGRTAPTAGAFLRRIGLAPADLPTTEIGASASLAYPEVRDELIDAVVSDRVLRGRIVAASSDLRRRIARYVRSELDPGVDEFTVVDLGWGATIQRALQEILDQTGSEVVVSGLYLATNERATSPIFAGCPVAGFLTNLGEPRAVSDVICRSPEVLEQVCMPACGTQVDLDDDLLPVTAPTGVSTAQHAEALSTRAGIRAFQRQWARLRTLRPEQTGLAESQDALRAILVRSIVAPTELEARCFGAWRHDENFGSTQADRLADPSAARRVRYMSGRQVRDMPNTVAYWPPGMGPHVDAAWGELLSAAAAGELSWEALSPPLGTGKAYIEVADAPANGNLASAWIEPERNPLGLALIEASLTAPIINGLNLVLCTRPGIIRLDWLELVLTNAGGEKLGQMMLDEPKAFSILSIRNGLSLAPNVIAAWREPLCVLELPIDVPGAHVAEIALGMAALPIPPLDPGLMSVVELQTQIGRLQQNLADVTGSASWRMTEPLRAARRRTRR